MAKRSDETLGQLSELKDLFDDARERHETETLLAEAHSLAGSEKRLKEIKEILKNRIQGYGGVRSGELCCIVRYQAGKSNLSKELLVDAGVTPEQIRAGTKQSDGYWVCELPKMGEDS
jgi:hypothetical protein